MQELRALIALSGAFAEVHCCGCNTVPLVPLRDEPTCDGLLTVLVKAST